MRPIVLTALFFLPWAAFAAEEDQAAYANVRTRTFSLASVDAATVASARLYVSQDDGRIWRQAQELRGGAGETLTFSYTAEQDGTYGFMTAVSFSDGHGDAEPRAGEAPQVRVVIDTATPVIELFQVRLESRVGDKANLRVSWAVADANPGSVILEGAAQGGEDYSELARAGSRGNQQLALSVPTGALQALVRVIAEDRAGNRTVGSPQTVDLPPATPSADTEGAAAMRALPPAGNDQRLAGSDQPIGSPLAAAEPPALSTRPDIVAPNALNEPPHPATIAAPADEEIVTSGGTDREVAARKSREPSQAPSWSKDRARSRLDDTSAAATQKSGASAPTTASSETTTTAPERVPGQPHAQPHLGPIAPHQAPKVLEQARTAVGDGDLMTARELYLRLRGTPVAAQALPEELRLMRAQGQVRTALGVIAGLQPELVSDEINIEYGRLLLAAGRAREAIAPLSKVRSSSAQASEALFLVAASLAADGRAEQARKVYGAVAASGGAFAGQAREALARLPASPQR